jgi:hypothetical protein
MAARIVILGFVLLTGCATEPHRYGASQPMSAGGARVDDCHRVATAAAEDAYARYSAIRGTDPLGRSSGQMFGGTALAEHAWAERERVYERQMSVCLGGKG